MSKEKMNEENQVELIWLDYFHTLKLNHPDVLIAFFNTLSDFVEQYPSDARALTLETMHGILLDEI